jgi:hypothetical protein
MIDHLIMVFNLASKKTELGGRANNEQRARASKKDHR